jgi:all-trans-retinol 13,14-reductase
MLSAKKINWCQLGHEDPTKHIYDTIKFGSDTFDFPSGFKNLKSNLIAQFPEEEAAIEKYFKLLKTSSTYFGLFFVLKFIASKFIASILTRLVLFMGRRFFKKTVDETLSLLTKNQKLKSILCTQFGDYGIVPTEAPFFIHSAIASHYLKGAHYPAGGSLEIAKGLIETIYLNGGKVLVGKKVKGIIIGENKEAIGVEMESGDVIGCNKIISSVGNQYFLIKSISFG